MSIQTAREMIAKNQGALISANATLFANLGDRHDAIKAKGNHPADIRRLRSEVVNWTKDFVAKSSTWNANDQAAYQGAMDGWIAVFDAELSNHDTVRAAFGHRAGSGSGWINADTGLPIKVLAPGEKMASEFRQPGDPTLGSIVAGLLGGAKTPEIRAALSEGTDSAGGYSVPTSVLPEFFDLMRAKTRFIQAGARTILLDTAKTNIMRIASDPVAAWRAEAAQVAESAPTFDAVTLVPKSLAVLVKVSYELLADSVNIEEALQKAIIGAVAVQLDQACLFGDGTNNSPIGLFNTSGINTVSMGTNGAQLTNYDPLIDAIYAMEDANADPATAAIMHPRTMQTARKFKDSTGQPLRLPDSLADLAMLSTTSAPINQTQGTAAGTCSSILVGDYDEAIIGLRQEMRIQRLNDVFADHLQVGFIAHLRADVGFAHPASFTKIVGIKP